MINDQLRMFSTLRSHTDVLQIAGPLEQQLASLTRLTSLSFSGGDLKRLGHLKRAHMVEQQAAGHGNHALQSRPSWKALQVLDLSDNALEQLPSEGWEWLSGLKELDLSCTSLSWLPGAISSLAGLTALRLSQNSGLESLPQELTALSKLAVFDASDNFMNGLGLEVSLASLAAAWPHLQWLALENTSSDFNGSLALPQELAGCSRLQELRLGWNQDLDWGSLQVLQQCTALRVLDLEGIGNAPPAAARPGLRQLLAQLRPTVAVNLGGRWI
ncbi:hypothetical protein OEZ86_011537 [Tetradesmus obliquus]|nr:hypothetical protein OEZ86_011537 [Tetradesmus obliquus]